MDVYITRKELRLPPYNLSIEDTDNKQLEVLQDLTKEFVDRICGQSFDQEGSVVSPVEYKVSGTGKDTVFLPKRIISLSKVRIYSTNTSFSDYDAENFYVDKKFISWNVYSDVYTTARASFMTDKFDSGKYNIGIFGVWGWDAPPNQIKYLQGRLIQKIGTDDSFAEKFQTERIGDYDSDIADRDFPITGDAELDLIIKQYRVTMFYAVS